MLVYLLTFPYDARVYVGITKNSLESRLAQHIEKLKNGRHNRKLLAAFPMCGIPKITLLEECTESNVAYAERFWINKYNSFNEGFNGNEGGWGGLSLPGEDNPSALYTEDDYACILICLAFTEWSLHDIAKELNVSYSVVRDISGKVSHTYLKDKYPEAYDIMSGKNKRHNINLRSHYPDIKGPDGTIYKIKSISDFAREHKLNRAHLSSVINGNRRTTEGYTLC